MSQVRMLAAGAFATAAVLGTVDAARAVDPIIGSGSTFAEVALDQWAADVGQSDGLAVDYAGIGSVAGLTQFQAGDVDFAVSDVRYPDGSTTPRPYTYVPVVAGGIALPYHLLDTSGNRITDLRLTPLTIASIFSGLITDWSDQRIAADNPTRAGRLAGQIRLAVRTPGAGTTASFTDYLSTVAPDLWSGSTTDWPGSCNWHAFAGSNEIAQYIARDTPGSHGAIGYVETAYAQQLAMPVAAVRNESGSYRLPTSNNVSVALQRAAERPDGTHDLDGVHTNPDPDAYPISSFSYAVVPTGSDFPAAKGEALARYLTYAVTDGQRKSPQLGYAPLPTDLVDAALLRIQQISGAPPTTGVYVAEYADATFAKGKTDLHVALGEIDDNGRPREVVEIDLRRTTCRDRSLVTIDVQLRADGPDTAGVAVDARGGTAFVAGERFLWGTRTTTPAGKHCGQPDPTRAVTEPYPLILQLDVQWRNARGSVPVAYGGADCGGDGVCYYRDATARAEWSAFEFGSQQARSTSGFLYEGTFLLEGSP